MSDDHSAESPGHAPPAVESPEAAATGAAPKPRRRKGVRFFAVYACYLALLGWGGLKAYWYIQYDVPVTRAPNLDDIWRLYYSELWTSGVIEAAPHRGDETFDVLLLGGSVLEQTAEEIERRLRPRFGNALRVYNLSKASHTSRDSLQKLTRLKEMHFDLIVVYHGINDVRMNCCAAEDYRADYSHISWYDSFQAKIKAKSLMIRGLTVDTLSRKAGLGPPDEDLLDLGSEIKTPPAFHDNIESIVTLAEQRRTPVVLMTFAYYIPADYSRTRFEAGRLDYGAGSYRLAAEVWGRPRNVAATVDAHNRVIREIRKQHGNVLFVDQRRLLAEKNLSFSDPCHLSDTGINDFVANLVPAVERHFDARQSR